MQCDHMQINCEQSKVFHGIDVDGKEGVLTDYATRLSQVVAMEDWQAPESSVCLPGSLGLYQASIDLINQLSTTDLQYVFLVGIGGSNLGTLAVHAALRNRFSTAQPELISLDTVSAADIATLRERFKDGLPSETYLIFVISKSGGTTETIANAELLYQSVLTDPVARTERTIVITDADSALDRYADEQTMARLHIPTNVGGRYSVFSPVGIAPLYALGYPTGELLRGARDIIPYCTHTNLYDNPAALVASKVATAIERGYTVYDLFVFDPTLEVLGKWNRQLVGESVGKRENTNGEVVETGIVPTVSVGSTDLHSVGQLYLGGLPTVMTMFVSVAQPSSEMTIPSEHTDRAFPTLVPDIAGHSTTDIQQAIFAGTKDAYNEAERPFCVAELANTSAYEIGVLMQYKMIETMYLAQALSVNAFDQPNVERYKKFTKEYLRK